MYEPSLPLVARNEAELLRLASLRLRLLLSGHTCPKHGDHCRDRGRAEEVIEEIGRRYPIVPRGHQIPVGVRL